MVRGDPPAAQVVGVEGVGLLERPARQVVGLIVGQAEAAGERAALVGAPGPDGGIVEVDAAAARARAAARRRARAAGAVTRVQSRPASRSAVACASIRRPIGRKRQPRRRDAGDAVAAQDRVGVLVAAGPRVGVVGVDGLVAREPHERGPAQVVERLPPAREAAQQLAAGVGLARLARERLAVGGRRARAARRMAARGRRRARRPRSVRASFSLR